MFDNRRRLGAICKSCDQRIRLIADRNGLLPPGGMRCPKCEAVVGFEEFRFNLGTPRWPKYPKHF